MPAHFWVKLAAPDVVRVAAQREQALARGHSPHLEGAVLRAAHHRLPVGGKAGAPHPARVAPPRALPPLVDLASRVPEHERAVVATADHVRAVWAHAAATHLQQQHAPSTSLSLGRRLRTSRMSPHHMTAGSIIGIVSLQLTLRIRKPGRRADDVELASEP